MNDDLHRDIIARIERDFGLKAKGDWLQQGECPSCGKRELYVHAEHPWVLRCGRLSKCGAEHHVKELYPDLFERWSERYQVTPEAPNAAADAYLQSARGFDLARIAGWYAQESYWDHQLNIGSATVRFPLPANNAGAGYWERIIDQPQRFGKRKATFNGKYQGTWWTPPGAESGKYAGGEIWIVEGIFDAVALLHNGISAAAALSCNNYPDKSLKALAEACATAGEKRPSLVWALDGDKAGRGYTRKHVARSRDEGWDASAAQIPQTGKGKLDWNDMHQRERLTPKHLDDYRYHGALLTAESAHEKALLIYSHAGYNAFHFDFDNRFFWFELNLEKFGKAQDAIKKAYDDLSEKEVRERAMLEAHTLREIANCHPTALYYQANTLTDESWYYLRVDFPHDGDPIKNTFTGSQLSSASEFKKRLLAIAPGAVFTGSAAHLDRWLQRQLFGIKTVQTIDFIGYSRDHGAYVFGDVAVKDGKQHELNDEDYFDIGRLSVKSLNQSVHLTINPELKDFKIEWVNLLWRCFGAKGVVALAFWLGSIFAEQIRAEHKSYPFLEVVGEPGAGKSTLIEFLWKLLGRRDYEGFDPSKSTLAARARNFAQVAGMPVVLIEGDRSGEDKAHAKGFDWDELKTAYNGRSVRSRGVKNGGNETYEPPFRGAIVISQNADVSASDAVLQRIVHINCDVSAHTPATKAAAEKLERMAIEDVSGFILKAALAAGTIMAGFSAAADKYEKTLQSSPDIKNLRIVKNHAQLMALVDALPGVVPISEDQILAARDELVAMAVARQQAINSDHPLVQEFWEIFDFLEGSDSDTDGTNVVNHSRGEGLIAINLNHFVQVATDRRQQIPAIPDLKRVLRTSRARKFIDYRSVNSVINAQFNISNARCDGKMPPRPSTVKCWVFKA